MRRGCQTILVYVDAGKYGIKGSRQRVGKIANYLASNFYFHKEPLKLVTLDFEPVYKLLKTEVTNVGIFAKKLMLDAVELLCEEFGAKSVVTGDDIKSMASGLFREKKFVYLYPIVGLIKTEVEKDARETGLYKFVIHNKKPVKKRAKNESIVLGKYAQLINCVTKNKKIIELK
jgi:adenylyl- and sulfurtransferase ThiI